MRVRGILTLLAVSTALSVGGPSVQAASKPRPTSTPLVVAPSVKSHQACTKTAVRGTKLCIRVEKKLTTAYKRKTTYLTLAASETRPVKNLTIALVVRTTAGKEEILMTCGVGKGACGSLFLNSQKYTEIRARLIDGNRKMVVQTPIIHLPLR